MTLQKVLHTPRLATAAAAALLLGSCGLVNDDSDCVASYNLVRFTYDYNMKFADAFGAEVESVEMLLFDSATGTLVKRVEASVASMNASHEIPLEVEPGSYDIIAWGRGGEHASAFEIATGTPGQSLMPEFGCFMQRDDEGGTAHVRDDISRLYHGMVHVELPYAAPSAPHRVTVPMKKDTNVIRVVLQHISGEPLDIDDYTVTITDDNGRLAYDNEPLPDDVITYHPWYSYAGSVDINDNPADAPTNDAGDRRPEITGGQSFGAMLSEFTVNRLHTSHEPRLTVATTDGRPVFSIKINDYALLVSGFYNRTMTPQEYLDRQDEYNMTFFLDEGNRWVSTCIIINDWRIIRNVTPVS